MKNRAAKEPTLLRQLISIHYEQALRRKALRKLASQEWSVEFLAALVHKASNGGKHPVEIELVNKSGNHMIIKPVNRLEADKLFDDNDIFNHLDDEAAVSAFIREHSRR